MAGKISKAAESAALTDTTTPAKMGAVLPWRRGRRGGLFYRMARNRAAEGLVRKHGYTEEEAQEAVHAITEREMDELADSNKMGDLGDGSLLQKIIDFISSEQFLKFIEAIMKIVLMFGKKAGKK